MLKMPLKNGWFLVEWKISRKPWFPRFSLSIDIHWPTKYLHLFIGQNPKHFWWLRPSPAPTNCPKSGLDLTSRITWVTHRCWITGYARLCYTDVAWVGVSKPKSGAPGNFRMIRMIVEMFFVERSASTLPHPRTISINPIGHWSSKGILGDGSTVPTCPNHQLPLAPWPKRGPFKLLRLHANRVIICIWKDLLLAIHLLASLKQTIHSKLVTSHGVLACFSHQNWGRF